MGTDRAGRTEEERAGAREPGPGRRSRLPPPPPPPQGLAPHTHTPRLPEPPAESSGRWTPVPFLAPLQHPPEQGHEKVRLG